MAEASKKRVARAEGARRYGPALDKGYQFMLWLIPAVEKFPRGQRFVLGIGYRPRRWMRTRSDGGCVNQGGTSGNEIVKP